MFTNQKEALKKVFSLYCVVSRERNLAYRLVDAIPELIQAFPSISLLEMKDDSDILKNIVMEKYKKNEKGGTHDLSRIICSNRLVKRYKGRPGNQNSP